MTSYDPKMFFFSFGLLKIIHGHSKTIVTCSTHRKKHAGRWIFVLAPSEAMSSAIPCFRHFSALDLTSEVTGLPRTLSVYINLFVSRRATCSFFPRSSSSIRGETARGVVPPPLCRGRMRNGLCRRGLRNNIFNHLDEHYSRKYSKKKWTWRRVNLHEISTSMTRTRFSIAFGHGSITIRWQIWQFVIEKKNIKKLHHR